VVALACDSGMTGHNDAFGNTEVASRAAAD